MLLVAATLCTCLAANFLTIAYQSGRSGFIGMLSYIVLVYSFLSDQFIFHEKLHVICLIAALVILLTNVVVTVLKMRKMAAEKKRKKQILEQDTFDFEKLEELEDAHYSQVEEALKKKESFAM